MEGSGRRAFRQSERRRSSLPGSIRVAALRRSARGDRCRALLCPSLEFERQSQRRERPGPPHAKALFQSARSGDQRSPEFRVRGAPAPARFVARSFPGVPKSHQALQTDRLPLGDALAARAAPVQRSRRSPRRANHQSACRRGRRPPRRRRGFAGPHQRYSTPSLYSCPRPSLRGRESPDERRRRDAVILSGVVVKKGLRALRRRPSFGCCYSCSN
jgi:hypothetical protein